MASLREKVVLITGASSGIGAGTAVHFAALGSKLSLCGRNEENLKKVAEKCKQAGLDPSDINIIIGDLSKEEDANRVIDQTISYFQRLDVLVNNAGILKPGATADTSLEDYDAIMNINVRSLFYLMQLAIPHLIKTKGNIVNVSSIAGLRAFPGIMSYCISKAAVDQLTRCAALELAAQGVRVNSVNPGVIVTEIHRRGGMSDQQYKELILICGNKIKLLP